MSFEDTYYSIAKNCEGLFKDKGSKFIAYAYPVSSEKQIKDILATLRKEHHSARHHCYAYRLGTDKQTSRSNDDGEPSNTAGKPILGQIQSKDLTNVLVVVVRYFGGTLLGVSGLIAAYREAATDALRNAIITEHHILFSYELRFAFEQMNDVMRTLKELQATIYGQEFEENCIIRFGIRKRLSEQAETRFGLLRNIQVTTFKSLV